MADALLVAVLQKIITASSGDDSKDVLREVSRLLIDLLQEALDRIENSIES